MKLQVQILMEVIMLVFMMVLATHADCSNEELSDVSQQCSGYQVKINGECRDPLCERGFFLKDGHRCHRCHYSCKSCIAYDVCDSCSGTRSLLNGRCYMKCPRKFKSTYSDGNPGLKVCAKRKHVTDERCEVSEWEPWTACGRVGGPNVRTRTRTVGDGPACVGIAPIQHRFCLSLGFGNDIAACVVSEWLPWEQCDSSCNNKFRRRRRIVETPADGIRRKRALCPNLVEEEPCPCYFQDNDSMNELSQCEMGDWTPWSECDAPCGRGTIKRTKSPVGPQYSPGCRSFTETRPCCQQSCQDYCSDVLLGEWSKWSKCEGTCEHSTKRRVRGNLFPKVLMFCELHNLFMEIPCEKKGCKDKCVLSEWGEWSECEAGMKTRHREMVSGSRCPSPELADSIPCS
ncbi:hypothetical protein ACHWQZ_G017486 [Mnemiopsis leidyi]